MSPGGPEPPAAPDQRNVGVQDLPKATAEPLREAPAFTSPTALLSCPAGSPSDLFLAQQSDTARRFLSSLLSGIPSLVCRVQWLSCSRLAQWWARRQLERADPAHEGQRPSSCASDPSHCSPFSEAFPSPARWVNWAVAPSAPAAISEAVATGHLIKPRHHCRPRRANPSPQTSLYEQSQ